MSNDRMGKPIFLTPDDLTDTQIEELKETVRNGGTAGIVIPEMTDLHIIRTKEELEALDLDTMLISKDDKWEPCIPMHAAEWLGDWHVDPDGIFPLAVIATGEQVRAARAALEKENT